MNVDEARQLLGCRRPGGQDDALPEMQQAIAKLEALPDYVAEMEQDREIDQWISGKLKGVEPPADFQARLLKRAAPRPPRPLYRQPFLWGVAAAAAAAVALLIWSRSGDDYGTDGNGVPIGSPQIAIIPPAVPKRAVFREDVVKVIRSIEEGKDKLDQPVGTVLAGLNYFHSASPPIDVPTPAGIASLPEAIGCKVFEWKGTRVSLLCVRAGSGTVHLFTVDAIDVPCDFPGAEHCCCKCKETLKDWNTLTWRTNGKVQVLVSCDVSPQEMERLIVSN